MRKRCRDIIERINRDGRYLEKAVERENWSPKLNSISERLIML